jgi:hypothetical protein
MLPPVILYIRHHNSDTEQSKGPLLFVPAGQEYPEKGQQDQEQAHDDIGYRFGAQHIRLQGIKYVFHSY